MKIKSYPKAIYNCKKCGTEIKDYVGHKVCYGCVIDEIYDAIAAGKEVTSSMRSNARYKGIDVKEIRQQVMEDAKIQSQKNCS